MYIGKNYMKNVKSLVLYLKTGAVPMSSQVNVSVKVMNKAMPVFEQPFYSVSIPENIQMHAAVTTVEAKSPNGRKLIYSIEKGNIYGEFAVDFSTGEN